MEGMALLQSGMSQSQVARALNVSRQSVSRWAQVFGSEGMEGLQKKAKPGRSPKLTNEQKKELIGFLGKMTGHSKGGYPPSGTEIASLILDQFGIEFHKNHIPRLLRSLKDSEDPMQK